MHSCWNEAPEQRPTFLELVEQISATLEEEAGYLEMSHSLTWKTQEHGSFWQIPRVQIDNKRALAKQSILKCK